MFTGLVVSSIIGFILTIILTCKSIILKTQLDYLNTELLTSKQEHDNLKVANIESIKKHEQLVSQIDYQSRLINDFEKLRLESQESTKAALFNLGHDLSKQLIEIHKKENREARELSENNIKVTATKFNQEFERLVGMVSALSHEVEQSKDTAELIKNSLLSPSGAGKLAEITLENILKASGLRSKIDFSLQHTILGEDNTKLRPDALVFLPSDNIMIIDAKASKFLVEDIDQAKLAKTMNIHLKSLTSKEYLAGVASSQSTRTGNIITLMFLPTEQAVEKLVAADAEFLDKAWRDNIFPVGPTGVMNMLSFARFQISKQLMMHNHQQIIQEVAKLIGSVAALSEHSSKLGNNIQALVNNYDKFAASFNHNFLSKVRSASRLGVEAINKKSTKPLPRYQIISSGSELIEVESEELLEIEETA